MLVYKVENIANKKIYIGQTIRDINIRKREHIYNAINGNSDYSPFHRAILKYGHEKFIWTVLCKCDSKEEMDDMEFNYIIQYKSHVSTGGYNATYGGDGTPGVIRSDLYKKKLSASKLGKKLNISDKERKRRSCAMSGKNNSCFKVHGKKHNSCKKYLIITPDGKQIIIEGLREFCRNNKQHKLYHSCLVKCANGEIKHHKGYKCVRILEAL